MKRIIAIILMCNAMAVNAMVPNQQLQAEDALLWAIQTKNLQGVKDAVEKLNAPVDEIKVLALHRGENPLNTAVAKGQYDIAEYLLSKGADKSVLNPWLVWAANGASLDNVAWLLKHGAKDINDEALKEAKDAVIHEHDLVLKLNYEKIIKLLEQSKRGPVRLTPLVRPIAHPATVASPVEKTITQPVRLVPITKPMAQPK